MSIFTRHGARRAPIELPNSEAERLIDLHSHVDPDGGSVAFDLSFTNQAPFRASIDLADMALIYAEIHSVSQTMLFRQRLSLDRGEEKLLELCQQSERLDRFNVITDPVNGDRIFAHQFIGRAPFAFRLPPLEVVMYLERVRRSLLSGLH